MNFWKKIFGKKETPITNSRFDTYKNELDTLGLRSLSDLEDLVKPIIQPATKIELQSASRPPENSQMHSHFGGNPYFEKGETWPTSKAGRNLHFIFQIFNTLEIKLPDTIELIQFYYDWEAFPWDTADDGWQVKIYKKLDPDTRIFIETPENKDYNRSKYCEIDLNPIKSLPDWEGIDRHEYNASKLSCVLNEDEPWSLYQQTVSKLIGDQEYQSQLGGYPKWVQGESTPKDSEGNPMKFLFQIDSEDKADLMWGDVGMIYVFYDEETDHIEFILQCH